MEPVTFAARIRAPASHVKIGVSTTASTICAVLAIVCLGLGWFGSAGIEQILLWGQEGGRFFWLVFMLAMAALWFAPFDWERVQLGRMSIACDDTGLTYACGGYSHTWPWHEVESFEVEAAASRQRHAKLAVARSPDWKARFRALLAGADVNPWGMSFHVMDVFDRPLEDIAAAVRAGCEQAETAA